MKTLVLITILAFGLEAYGQDSPNIYLESKSVGNNWAAFRDQSQEMAKDFVKVCPGVQVTTNQREADYFVILNHIEAGLFWRDNQIAVTDTFGTVLSTKEGNSISSGVKRTCALIRADWSNPTDARQRLVKGLNTQFQKGGIAGYAELTRDKLTIHSERASSMRFRMLIASRVLSMIRRAGITTWSYTNDADQNFEYDVKSEQIVTPSTHQAAQGDDSAER